MLEEAIALIEKQIDMYKILNRNIRETKKKYTIENKVKKELKEEIKIRKLILDILEERREDECQQGKVKKRVKKLLIE